MSEQLTIDDLEFAQKREELQSIMEGFYGHRIDRTVFCPPDHSPADPNSYRLHGCSNSVGDCLPHWTAFMAAQRLVTR